MTYDYLDSTAILKAYGDYDDHRSYSFEELVVLNARAWNRIGVYGGIFIGSSSEVHAHVPVENAAMMYRTVHEYGQFPIDLERVSVRRQAILDSGDLKLRSH